MAIPEEVDNLAIIYKVWAQVERVDETADFYENAELPDCLGIFRTEESAREFVLGLLLIGLGTAAEDSDQVPAWFRGRQRR